MKICVVGGTGNIGRSVTEKLIKEGHEVFCFNRGLKNKCPPGAHSINGDRNDPNQFENLLRKMNFDYAIDMICMNKDHALSTLRAFHNVKHLIICSSISTYGFGDKLLPINEESTLNPNTNYGRKKVEADNVFINYYKKNKFPVSILKLSLTYGPQMGLLRQISSDFSWIDRIRKGQPIIICDNGEARCQFMHVDDAAIAFKSLLGKKESFGEVFNLVDKNIYTWRQYHKTAMSIIGKNVKIIEVSFNELQKLKIPGFKLCREVFKNDLYFCSKKLNKVLPEFRSQISLEEGMRGVINHMDMNGVIEKSFIQNWEERIIRKKRNGTINNYLLINSFLFNVDRLIFFINRILKKILDKLTINIKKI